MADRQKPHNGRDLDGHFRVRQADVNDLLEDPAGPDIVRDDVRLGGAIIDTGPQAGMHAKEISERISENRTDVDRATGRAQDERKKSGKPGKRR